jgi:hypothetical protein
VGSKQLAVQEEDTIFHISFDIFHLPSVSRGSAARLNYSAPFFFPRRYSVIDFHSE